MEQPRTGPGRRHSTSRARLEQIAIDLFTRHGFEATTVDEIAAAAGIGRRTFFRYHESKNDVVWGDFDLHLAAMRSDLAAGDPAVAVGAALRRAVVTFNDFPPEEEARLRQRMTLILRVPALQAHSTLRYAAWRSVVADFVAERTGDDPSALGPQVMAHTALGAAIAAYDQWLSRPGSSLVAILDAALAVWLDAGRIGPGQPPAGASRRSGGSNASL